MKNTHLIPYFRSLNSAVAFHTGFSQKTTRKYPTTIDPSVLWGNGLDEVYREDKANRNWTKIIRLIHGHTWINYYLKTSTAELIGESKINLHPDVKVLLDETAKSLLQHLNT